MTSTFHFLHIRTDRSWTTDEPHGWLLDRRDDPILARARDRLLLGVDDPDRCLRVVLRRCGLVIVLVGGGTGVVVRHWGKPIPDIKVWAKRHRLNKTGVQVAFVDEKSGRAVVLPDGQDALLYGGRVGAGFPWPEYEAKYDRRQVEEAGDGGVASASATNFSWPGSPPGRLTWGILKRVWIAEKVPCPNCDVPLVLADFSWQKGALSFRSARLVRHCFRCRRMFEIAEERPLDWIASVLGPRDRPTYLDLWRRFRIDWYCSPPRLA